MSPVPLGTAHLFMPLQPLWLLLVVLCIGETIGTSRVCMLIGSSSLANADDALVYNYLVSHSFTVTTYGPQTPIISTLSFCDVYFVSTSASLSSDALAAFQNLSLPLVIANPSYLTSTALNLCQQIQSTPDASQMTILPPPSIPGTTIQLSPVAAGFTQNEVVPVTSVSVAQSICSAPHASATLVASSLADKNQASIVTYNAGAVNLAGKAVFARVVVFLVPQPLNYVSGAWSMFGAAVSWASARCPTHCMNCSSTDLCYAGYCDAYFFFNSSTQQCLGPCSKTICSSTKRRYCIELWQSHQGSDGEFYDSYDSQCLIVTETPTPTQTPTYTTSPTPSISDTITPTTSPTSSSSLSSTMTTSDTRTPTFTITRSPSSTPTETLTTSLSPTMTPSGTLTESVTLTRTPTFTNTETLTPSATDSISPTDTPSFTPTPTETPSTTLTSSATQSPTDTPTWTSTPSSTGSITPTASPTSSPTLTPTPTLSSTLTLSPTQSTTSTPSESPSVTLTPTLTLSSSSSPSPTRTRSATSTDTRSATATMSATPINSLTRSPTLTRARTLTSSATATSTRTLTNQITKTSTSTPTSTPLPTATATGTRARTPNDLGFTKVCLIVGDPSSLTANDQALINRFEDHLDYRVTIVGASTVDSPNHVLGYDLVYVSPSIPSTSVTTLGPILTDLPVAVITADPRLFEPLGLGVSPGTVIGTNVSLSTISNPLLRDLPSSVLVYDPTTGYGPITFVQSPDHTSSVLATVNGDPTKAALTLYDEGDSLVKNDGSTAPAPRVAFFGNDPVHLTSVGWQVFDNLVVWASKTGSPLPPNALRVYMITGQYSANDELFFNRLWKSSLMNVTIIHQALANVNDAARFDLIFLAGSITSTSLASTFDSLAVPVFLVPPILFGPTQFVVCLSSGFANVDSGSMALHIDDPTHPIAAGLSGVITILTAPCQGCSSWCESPDTSADVIASYANDSARKAIVVYNKGDHLAVPTASAFMPGPLNAKTDKWRSLADPALVVAPARRVVWFSQNAVGFTLNAWSLFDSSVAWLTGPVPNNTNPSPSPTPPPTPANSGSSDNTLMIGLLVGLIPGGVCLFFLIGLFSFCLLARLERNEQKQRNQPPPPPPAPFTDPGLAVLQDIERGPKVLVDSRPPSPGPFRFAPVTKPPLVPTTTAMAPIMTPMVFMNEQPQPQIQYYAPAPEPQPQPNLLLPPPPLTTAQPPTVLPPITITTYPPVTTAPEPTTSFTPALSTPAHYSYLAPTVGPAGFATSQVSTPAHFLPSISLPPLSLPSPQLTSTAPPASSSLSMPSKVVTTTTTKTTTTYHPPQPMALTGSSSVSATPYHYSLPTTPLQITSSQTPAHPIPVLPPAITTTTTEYTLPPTFGVSRSLYNDPVSGFQRQSGEFHNIFLDVGLDEGSPRYYSGQNLTVPASTVTTTRGVGMGGSYYIR